MARREVITCALTVLLGLQICSVVAEAAIPTIIRFVELLVLLRLLLWLLLRELVQELVAAMGGRYDRIVLSVINGDALGYGSGFLLASTTCRIRTIGSILQLLLLLLLLLGLTDLVLLFLL